ncbi:MAG: amidohydrolase [Bacteroidetes bacterium]|nr:amidohydrolase [Bacteroidota bacterium]
MENHIKALAQSIKNEIIEIRHHIHSHPELSFEEENTAQLVEKFLSDLGLEPKRIGKTGVWAMIKGNGKKQTTVALRADLDALPIQEKSNREYASKNPGVMHACGHDVHTSSLLGAAKILTQIKEHLDGDVKLIFQPGEEKLPGGASILIKEGVLTNPKVDAIIGQHVMPFIHTGKVGFRKGLYMASTDEIYITIHGKGGHGAMPHLCIDPVAVSAQVIVALQQVVSRKAQPIVPTVLTFGKINSDGGATNIIPNAVSFEGTLRTLNEPWRAECKQLITKIAQLTAEAYGATAEVRIEDGYPFLKNDEAITDKLILSAQKYMGEQQVEELDIWMAAEDFAFYSQSVPACFYRLGTRNEAKGIVSPVHTNTFDIDEDAIETGCGLLAYLAYDFLNKSN